MNDYKSTQKSVTMEDALSPTDEGFNHSQQYFNPGEKVIIDKTREKATVIKVIPTPGGWVYNLRLDTPRSGLLEGLNFQYLGDELTRA